MNVWIIEDERPLAEGLKVAFKRKGYDVETAPGLAGLKDLLESGSPEIIFLDVRLEDGDGLKALPHILQASPEAKVIVMTAFGDSALVVRAIREGAFNYLDKPFPLEAAMNMAHRASEAIGLSRKVYRMESSRAVSMIGSSSGVKKVSDFVAKVSKHRDVNVLVRGESGTGKEVVARMIHSSSGCHGEFVAINCAAIPETLLETELFGSRKGSYTGSNSDKKGLAELADGGTLFLDEIGDMPLSLQGKLLRFLDSRTIRPIGASKEIQVSLNVVCATCVDLETRISQGTFRPDLFYRISMLPLDLPPLREREEDVSELLGHFVGLYSDRLGRSPLIPSQDVEEVFSSYHWPGNVRELKNLVERLFILKEPGDQVISLKDLPQEMLDCLPSDRSEEHQDGRPLQLQVDDFERRLLEQALNGSEGNRTKAASALGLSRYALLRRLQKHGID
ncbi:MAG: sigma-54 dependent transcriptional regulator [Dethiosulfovibrio sp.]|nr:sigma-54 dependent transcriptional regulator [Dethiosulfovibrio sp.]